jgi:acyl-CoA synthetase (AMP-forming)/AMP-acid ligase II
MITARSLPPISRWSPGLDFGDVLAIISGAERVRPATIKRFNERLARFNSKDTVIRPSYGRAEPTLWAANPFGSRIVAPSAGTPVTSWLRTGDLGVIFEGELFILRRLEDVLIVDGGNHYPDDIEATVHEITGGRVAAISAPGDSTERLVVIVELEERDRSDADYPLKVRGVKREMISAI